MNSNQKVNEALARLELGSRIKGYTVDRDVTIPFIFRCDMTTAQQIVNRIGDRLRIGHDPIVVLKTACPRLIAQCILEELEPGTAARHPLTDEDTE